MMEGECRRCCASVDSRSGSTRSIIRRHMCTSLKLAARRLLSATFAETFVRQYVLFRAVGGDLPLPPANRPPLSAFEQTTATRTRWILSLDETLHDIVEAIGRLKAPGS
jgi:hypothetical protein